MIQKVMLFLGLMRVHGCVSLERTYILDSCKIAFAGAEVSSQDSAVRILTI